MCSVSLPDPKFDYFSEFPYDLTFLFTSSSTGAGGICFNTSITRDDLVPNELDFISYSAILPVKLIDCYNHVWYCYVLVGSVS